MSRKTKYDSYDDRFKATAIELGALPGVKAIILEWVSGLVYCLLLVDI